MNETLRRRVWRTEFLFFFLCLALLIKGTVAPRAAFGEDAILEDYSIGWGGTSASGSAGVAATLDDKYFGGGTAEASIKLAMKNEGGDLTLKVWRNVAPGEIAFALLVFRVEVVGYSYSGARVYSKKLGGFTFGDSKSGTWSKKLKGIPSNARKINMIFYGNYE